MRDKLIELICDGTQKTDICTTETYMDCETCRGDCGYCTILADHLIANGVTVAENNNVPTKWIPVSKRLPKNDYEKPWTERKHYLVFTFFGRMMVARFGSKEYLWWVDGHDCVISDRNFGSVTHWMPLPKPPKGE